MLGDIHAIERITPSMRGDEDVQNHALLLMKLLPFSRYNKIASHEFQRDKDFSEQLEKRMNNLALLVHISSSGGLTPEGNNRVGELLHEIVNLSKEHRVDLLSRAMCIYAAHHLATKVDGDYAAKQAHVQKLLLENYSDRNQVPLGKREGQDDPVLGALRIAILQRNIAGEQAVSLILRHLTPEGTALDTASSEQFTHIVGREVAAVRDTKALHSISVSKFEAPLSSSFTLCSIAMQAENKLKDIMQPTISA